MAIRPYTIQEQLARRVRQRRKIMRLTQAELARLSGTSQTAITRVERAEGNPGANFIQRLTDVLEFELILTVHPTQGPKFKADWLK